MVGTIWAVVPTIIAIVLALVTKQVYISLFLGILVGSFFLAKGSLFVAFEKLIECIGGQMAGDHAYILLFTLCLGILVILITASGGTKAYGNWAAKRIKTKKGALLSTFGLCMIIFVDDYFSCLTVGNVMRPVTDKNKVSRAKLAYFIDSTAAPMCVIMPISSWAASVGSTLNISNGLEVFLKSIPFNLYAILTMVMVFVVAIKNLDFGPMKTYEDRVHSEEFEEITDEKIGDIIPNEKGRVFDLLIPIGFLIITSVLFMLYTGGLFAGADKNIIDAISGCNAGLSLAMSSVLTLIFSSIYYLCRKLIKFNIIGESIIDGFKSMAPTLLVLILAWSIGAMCANPEYLNLRASSFFTNLKTIGWLFPCVIFLISCGVSFATGTSWGTFAMMLPMVSLVCSGNLFFIGVGAVLGGAVVGDHISPISDTTILAVTGAKCDHLEHVKSQAPYAIIVAVIAFVMYFILGLFTLLPKQLNYLGMSMISIVLGLAFLFATIYVLDGIINEKKEKAKPKKSRSIYDTMKEEQSVETND